MSATIEYPVFDEASELFGAPPDDAIAHRLGSIFGMIIGQNPEAPLDLLLNAGTHAVAAQGDAYYAALEEAMKTGVDLRAADHRQLQDFFHVAARYGEARMLSFVIADLFQRFATIDAPETNHRN